MVQAVLIERDSSYKILINEIQELSKQLRLQDKDAKKETRLSIYCDKTNYKKTKSK
jgi:hypothetical protein